MAAVGRAGMLRHIHFYSILTDRLSVEPTMTCSRIVVPCLLLLAASVSMTSCPAADKFENVQNTENPDVKLTRSLDALAGMKLPDGFRISLFAAEPDVRQPIALATDDRGRLWVVENYSYAQRDVNFDDGHQDRILILEDTDHDGQFDSRKVFWDKGRRLTSVEIGHGGVWVLDAPNMLFIPDRDGDDVPDSEPVVMLDGWDDGAVRHNIVNGLRWGPDGWLYGRHGILATSLVGPPGASLDQRVPLNCSIWRYHPTKGTIEAVAHGTTNPWGMDWDEHGQLVFINTVIGHLWHVVPGAYFRRMYGEHFNPHVYQVIEQTADHFHWDTNENWSDIRKLGVTPTTDQAGGGHAHSGMVICSEPTWPAEFQRSVLTVNLHGQRLNRDVLERDGCTYAGHHADDFMKASDPWFRGVELHFGRHGELYLADWSDVGECHENDGVHRTSGRIYRITWEGAASTSTVTSHDSTAARKAKSIADLSSADLAAALIQTSEWTARRAVRLFTERAAAGGNLQAIRRQLISNLDQRTLSEKQHLRSLWALNAIGGADETLLTKLLSHHSEHVRVWSIQLLLERGPVSAAVLKRFAEMAGSDRSGLVLTWLASALQKLPVEQRWPIATGLAAWSEHADDRVFPLMLWYGIEGAVPSNSKKSVELVATSRIPVLREFVTRRLTLEIERQPAAINDLVELLAARPSDASLQHDILTGMTAALRGWRKAPQPASWPSISKVLAQSGNSETQQLVRELSLVFGDGRAVDELRRIAEAGSDLDERRSAIRALVVARADNMVPMLRNLLGNRDLAEAAINGLAAYDHPETARLLVSRYSGLRNEPRREAVNTLVSRPSYASVMLDAVASGAFPRSEISAFQLRQMQSYGSPDISRKIAELWPELAQQDRDKAEFIASLRRELTAEVLEKADRSAGRLIFSKSCANCHKLFGDGQSIAPDLTGAQRTNLNYLLENIVDPSATVSKNYKMSVVQLIDGRVLNGVISEQTEKTITLQTATRPVVIARDEIEESVESEFSMMPNNQLQVMKGEQIRNLISYLMSPSQVPLPE
jgi:putative membrane-bound dehydrogenase-like protein